MSSLTFRLDVEDGWPPVAAECLLFIKEKDTYTATVAPLFIKDLSVGDVIRVNRIQDGQITDWEHITRSNNSTIWLLCIGPVEFDPLLPKFQELGCNATWSNQCGVCSIDVSADVNLQMLDTYLEQLQKNNIAVAFPSWRRDADT